MKYNGSLIGPVIRKLREDRKWTIEQMSEKTGLSVSGLKQLEQGGRNMSMKSLYLFMTVFQCDANTLLDIEQSDAGEASVDKRLNRLPETQRLYLQQSFLFMLDQAEALVS